MKLITWTAEQAKKELASRLAYAMEVRARHERDWQEAENALFSTRGNMSGNNDLNIGPEAFGSGGEIDQGNADYKINYAYKNYRYTCSQLAANPPSVIPRPTSSDFSDRRKADAADRLVKYARVHYELGGKFEELINYAMAYGTGGIKTIWDPAKGDPMEFNAETGELLMSGDLSIQALTPWAFYLDPDASTQDQLKYIFEKISMPFDEAMSMFPAKEDELKKYRKQKQTESQGQNSSMLAKEYYDAIEVFQYWEKGMPHNGYVGRFAWHLQDGTLLSELGPNPFRFSPPADKGIAMPESDTTRRELMAKAHLPYRLFTDGDIPNSVYGKATVLYATPLQDLHTRLFNSVVDSIQAHGIPRIILPEGSEIAENSITNSPWDVIRINGSQDPHFMEPMPLPAAVTQILDMTRTSIDDMCGVNEAMFGQQSREQSGFSMQYATAQGNMVRQRVFNKFRTTTEGVFKDLLSLMRKHWDETRTIYVLGKEKAFEAIDLKGADIEGGFDLVVEYGSSLSIDPTARREEIITLIPVFKEAGIDMRTILGLLKLNELEGAYDRVTMAADRQREYFEEMINTNTYVHPREMQDQPNMLAFAYDFLMSAEFRWLNSEHQEMIERHIKEREQLAATAPRPAATPAGGGAPSGPLPPVTPTQAQPIAGAQTSAPIAAPA